MSSASLDFMNIEFEEKEKTDLQKAIVSAVAYFDLFDFPMTDSEIWRSLGVKADLSKVQEILTALSLRGPRTMRGTKQSRQSMLSETASPLNEVYNGIEIETKDGFYFLKGRRNILETRKERRVFYDRKIKRTVKIVKLFKFIPWVKMIAVSNIMGANNLRDESDIDLFIITQDKRIWLTRFFCASLAQLLGLRPKKGDMRDKICLNFYVSEEAIYLKDFMIDESDIYFVYWLVGLTSIYDRDRMYKRFIKANDWIRKYLPNSSFAEINKQEVVQRSFSALDFLFSWLEKLFKKLQLKLMPKEMKELMNKDTRVVVNDKVLKMHVNDRREMYREKWEKKIEDL